MRMIIRKIKNVGALFETKDEHYQLNILSEYYMCLKHLLILINQSHSSTQYYYFDQRVKDCINYIQMNYTYKIDMTDLCEISQISQSETIKLFKRYVGMTPFQYVLNYRLEKGAKQLKLSHNNVTEVAMDCGFSTTSYFIKMFKDKYKVTPKQFQLLH